MQVKQIYEILNTTVQETLGDSVVVNEDLTNIVDVGNAVFNNTSVDNFVKKLVNRIGKTVFTIRKYAGGVPSVFMDSWEFGSVLQKISVTLPEASENTSWNLVNGQEYSSDVFYQPSVESKFFNSKVTFEIPMSFTELQVKESFTSAEQLNGFMSMIFNAIDTALTVRIDNLIMRTINNMAGETIYNDLYSGTGETVDYDNTGVKAVNLLKLYNTKFTKTLTADTAITDPDFIKFANYTINLYSDRLTKISTLFNVGGKERFTPKDKMHTVLLSEFANSSRVYLESDIKNKELVSLSGYETVPYWQSSGVNYSFADTSKIDIKTSSGHVINTSGILGVIFDDESLGVTNLDRRVTTNYNPKAEFYTNFYKVDSGYFNDLNENFVVFFVA